MKKRLSFLWKLLIIVVTGIGLYLNFKFIGFKLSLAYFTILSNIFCFIFYLIDILFNNLKKKKSFYYKIKGTMIMSITITMIIYTFLAITNNIVAYNNHLIECMFVHYLTPILVLLEYFLYEKKGNIKWYYPFIWSVVLPLYWLFIHLKKIQGFSFLANTKYPYIFMDYEKYGAEKVFVNLFVIYIVFLICGMFFKKIDRFMAKGEK